MDKKEILLNRRLAALRDKLTIRERLYQEELKQKELDHKLEMQRAKTEAERDTLRLQLELLKKGDGQAVAAQTSDVTKLNSPKLSFIIQEFYQECERSASTMKKYKSTFPVFLELVGDVYVGNIDHFDVNNFFGELHKLPPRRDGKFKGMSYKKMIANNGGEGLAKKTFMDTKAILKCL